MVQYSYPGQTCPYQSVPGYQDLASRLQGSTTNQDYPIVIGHQNDVSSCPNRDGYNEVPNDNVSGFEAPHLSDSGYQDSTGGFQDESSHQYQTLATDVQVDTSRLSGQVSRHQGKNELNPSTDVPKSDNSPQKTPQKKSASNSNQDRENFTKLKPANCTQLEASRNSAVDQASFTPCGRYSRFYPSPYKSFGPFTGNPSPRHFPFPSGPRPYYSGQGRGRGRIWGYNGGGGRGQGDYNGTSIQKKKQGKKSTGSDKRVVEDGVAKNVGGEVEMTGNQPDILQGPLQKLEIK
eukprot:GFUD01022932.1.p1 GENE.GFUD01022932.1~~GFUD01022932.1.p1  ORF type:complete len:300 (+),score=66.04 GFUD01022932.1:30-902(+)